MFKDCFPQTDKTTKFYSHTKKEDGDLIMFSNLYPSNITLNELDMPTVEAGFQYMKLCDEPSIKFYHALLHLYEKNPKSMKYVEYGQGRLTLSSGEFRQVSEYCVEKYKCSPFGDKNISEDMVALLVKELGLTFSFKKSLNEWKMNGRPVLDKDWEETKFAKVLRLLRQKFNQEPYKQTLLLTSDSYMIEHVARDKNWGDGHDGSGTNFLGKLLMVARYEIYHDVIVNDIDKDYMMTPMKQLYPEFYVK